eukprot:g5056.t1
MTFHFVTVRLLHRVLSACLCFSGMKPGIAMCLLGSPRFGRRGDSDADAGEDDDDGRAADDPNLSAALSGRRSKDMGMLLEEDNDLAFALASEEDVGADADVDDGDRDGSGPNLSAALSGRRSEDMDMLPEDDNVLAFALACEEGRSSEE